MHIKLLMDKLICLQVLHPVGFNPAALLPNLSCVGKTRLFFMLNSFFKRSWCYNNQNPCYCILSLRGTFLSLLSKL